MNKRVQEHVNPTAAKWIAEGWEPNCQDDYEWATDQGQYAEPKETHECPICGEPLSDPNDPNFCEVCFQDFPI